MGSLVESFEIHAQPDDTTCGPTSLHAVYRHYGDEIGLEEVIAEVPALKAGGTLDILLARHALERGYDVTLYSYNLRLFDPSWLTPPVDPEELCAQLAAQRSVKAAARLERATEATMAFVRGGGRIVFEDLSPRLLRELVEQGPVITGVSATWLYQTERELPEGGFDAVRGEPCGHFVVLTQWDPERRTVRVADPLADNPLHSSQRYDLSLPRLTTAILLGVLTYDGNLVVIRPKPSAQEGS